MELNSFNWKCLVADAHDDTIFRAGRHFQNVRKCFGIGKQGMIAPDANQLR